jgi:hypothetical protein
MHHRRRVRGTLLTWSLAATLTALAFTGAARLGWAVRGGDVAIVSMVVAVVLLVLWIRRVRRMSARGLARELDERWALKARLESSVELAGLAMSTAQAQRVEATRHVAGRSPPGEWAWLSAWFVLAVSILFLTGEGVVLGWRGLGALLSGKNEDVVTVPSELSSLEAASTEAEVLDELNRGKLAGAIEWRSPASEITATAIEEVPLLAWVQTQTGVRAANLEMVVNGAKTFSRPLESAVWVRASESGGQEVAPSLFLDELGVKPFDIVSYQLVLELAGPSTVKVSSLPQFVQIRAVRRDVKLKGGSSELVALLMELKAAQLGLLKQNLELARETGAPAERAWEQENARVAREQEALGARVDHGISLARDAHAPALVASNFAAASDLMENASEQIAARENTPATAGQERALALLTELQQFIEPSMEGGPATPDPFGERQVFEVEPREETIAGRLELAAARQRANNARLVAEGGGPAVMEEQAAIVQELDALRTTEEFDADVSALVATAEKAAAEAQKQLAANDPAMARVPAAAAERALDQALAVQDKAGRAVAAMELDRLRRKLNAATRLSGVAQDESLREWRAAVRSAAVAQQRTGSAAAARELTALARRDGEPAVTLASAAAQVQVLLMPRGAALNRAIRPLRRVGEELVARRGGDDGLADLEMASQEAAWLTSVAATNDLSRRLTAQADALLRAASIEAAAGEAAGAMARELAGALERGTTAARDGTLRLFNPAEIDPRYRTAVETYFERLSREAQAPRKADAP